MTTVIACDVCKHVFKTADTARRHQRKTGHRGTYEVQHGFNKNLDLSSDQLQKDAEYPKRFKLGMSGF